MTKNQLIDRICKIMKGANREYLKTRTIKQLQETYSRWVAINSVTESEMKLHCDVSFIK